LEGEIVMEGKRQVSLAFVVAVYSAVVIATGMAVYAVYQYFSIEGVTISGLVFEHTWHVLVLGPLIYVTLYAVLYRKVVRPIRDLYLKLYAITRGNMSSITVDTNIAEIAEIAEGVQLLVAETERGVPKVSLSELSKSAQELRSLMKESTALDEYTKGFLLKAASRIEEAVFGLSPAKPKQQESKPE